MKTIIVTIVLVLMSCKENEVHISEVSYSNLKFSELPSEIVYTIKNPSLFRDTVKLRVGNFINLDKNDYIFNTEKTLVGNWIDKYVLYSPSSGYTYTIDRGTSTPVILFNNNLYISNTYNFMGKGFYLDSLSFRVYELY